MSASPLARLLIIDDEAAQMRALCDTLELEGYATRGYTSAKQALQALKPGEFDLVLSDLMMPEMDGISLLSAIKLIDAQLASVIMTGHGTIDTAVRAMQVGALDYIVKPFRLSVILPVLARALEVRRLRLDNAALQARERQYVADLEAANKQLEAFSFSISHDLRAPLHSINGFCDLFMTQFADTLEPEGRRLLDHVLNSARRMNQLIEDLLSFCRFSRQPLNKLPLPLNHLVQRALTPLQAANAERAVEFKIGTLPTCNVDPSLMEQVFVNLLSNAYKFTRQRALALIEVGCEQRDGEQILFVRDNGAGFDMKYVSKLFGVFARLHSGTQFEGTGVGLSIVQQIITRHGGRIWAEGAAEQGATFFFTLATD